MMSSYVLSSIITDVRTVTLHDSDTQITDTQLVALLKAEYALLRRRLADIVPDLYTVYSASWTLTQGGTNSQDLSASPVSATDVSKIQAVERQDASGSGVWYPVPLAPRLTADVSGTIRWRQRGATIVDIFPPLSAAGIYRAIYTSNGGINSWTTSTAIDIPDGADAYLRERVAATVRVRFGDDPSPHLTLAADLWTQLRDYLKVQNPATPNQIIDATGIWG